MIEIAGGIILAVIALALAPLAIGLFVIALPFILGVSGCIIVAFGAWREDWILIAIGVAVSAMGGAIGWAMIRDRHTDSVENVARAGLPKMSQEEWKRLERLVDFKADREREARWR